MISIIIAGSRDFNNYDFLKYKLNNIIHSFKSANNIEIVSGGARGADKLGERYASELRYPLKVFPADWDKLGKSAGYARNVKMANYASQNNGVLVAFWDGSSKGTKHMIDTAKKSGLEVYTYKT